MRYTNLEPWLSITPKDEPLRIAKANSGGTPGNPKILWMLILRNSRARLEFSGVILITKGEYRIYSGAFGYAGRAWQIRNSPSIRFDTASITKLFTAVAILQLVDQKLLSLETSAIRATPGHAPRITIRSSSPSRNNPGRRFPLGYLSS